MKKFDEICWKLAANVLNKPGTIVERMRNFNSTFDAGQGYEVIGNSGEMCGLKLKGVEGFWDAEKFRKIGSLNDT